MWLDVLTEKCGSMSEGLSQPFKSPLTGPVLRCGAAIIN